MTDLESQKMKQMFDLAKAIRFNHDKSGSFKVMVDPDHEIDLYKQRITQLTLPARFGMYKTPRNFPEKTPVDVEDPTSQSSSSSSSNLPDSSKDSSHKTRPIFG